jgi:hypothetical protein
MSRPARKPGSKKTLRTMPYGPFDLWPEKISNKLPADFKPVAGELYWLPVATRRGKTTGGHHVWAFNTKRRDGTPRVGYRRACEKCGMATMRHSEPLCPACGGAKHASANRAANARRKATRDAQQPALRDLAEKHGVDTVPPEGPSTSVTYAALNPQNGQRPYLCRWTGRGYLEWCPHGMFKHRCTTCTLITNRKAICQACTEKRLSPKRIRLETPICAGCERARRAEGTLSPGTTMSQEDHFFDALRPLITDADGDPFAHEPTQRKNGALGTSSARKRRRECDTTTHRFPDRYWLLRGTDAFIRRAVVVECDEHSHGPKAGGNYTPKCEAGKVDDEFQAIQQLAAHEGAARGARAGRHDAHMVPIIFVKVNPNACDVVPPVKYDDRVRTAAALINGYLHERIAAPTDRPTVHCLFYHSVEGGPHLAHFDAHAGAWDWRGNTTDVKF